MLLLTPRVLLFLLICFLAFFFIDGLFMEAK